MTRQAGIMLAVILLVAVPLAVAAVRMHREVCLTAYLGVGLAKADAVRIASQICGHPLGLVQSNSDYDTFGRGYERPVRMPGTEGIAFRVNHKIVYIFVGRDGNTTCVYWARRSPKGRPTGAN